MDDQPARLLTYRAILEPLGHNLVAVNSGLEALDALMKQEFAVVLLDVKMPGMDGFETAELIHDHPRFETIPIIFVTGVHVTEFDRLKGYKAGAIDYVYIPVVPEILRSKVAVLVELYRQAPRAAGRQQGAGRVEQARSRRPTTRCRSEKTRELEELNGHLQRANDELSRSNQSLETEIRERTRAENMLKEAVVKRDEFLAMLSHELRNPLSPLRNASHMLMQGETQDPKIIWSRGVIERQLKHMIRLVDDLLDVSRIARGKIVLVSERVNVAEIVAAAVETVQPLLEQKQQELEVEHRRRRTSPCAAIRCGSRRWSATCCTTPPSTRARAAASCSPRAPTRAWPRSACATAASASPPNPCRTSSSCSRRFRANASNTRRRTRHRPRAGARAGRTAWRRDQRDQRRGSTGAASSPCGCHCSRAKRPRRDGAQPRRPRRSPSCRCDATS